MGFAAEKEALLEALFCVVISEGQLTEVFRLVHTALKRALSHESVIITHVLGQRESNELVLSTQDLTDDHMTLILRVQTG